ncbi:uncharacterized protein DNG_08614 [Cephalotrichum gorgonifer]|uniref:SNF2_N domain-containing protein/Helicase_C domain-containing protein n=1 Tax=Cephalotrichum gorgonifer TaxID=2041049 RepID=A0AAE8SYI8_9PEZI|nr:uncharacterized protein DNG_08614 [Cephalotrichum gorgonifer]
MSHPPKRSLPAPEAASSADISLSSTKQSREPPCKKIRLSEDSLSHGGPEPMGRPSHTPDLVAPACSYDRVTSSGLEASASDELDGFDDGLESDEFESIEDLLTAPLESLTTPSTKRVRVTSIKPETTSKADIKPETTSKSDIKVDTAVNHVEEKPGSCVIDLTGDDEDDVKVFPSNLFASSTQPATPGVKTKHGGGFSSPSVRPPLCPIPANKSTPYKLEDQKPIYPATPLSGRRQPHATLNHSTPIPRGGVKPEDPGAICQYGAGATPTTPTVKSDQHLAPAELKYGDPRAPVQDRKNGLFKDESANPTPSLPRHPSSSSRRDVTPKTAGSPTFDMSKFLVVERKLAAMPNAAQPFQLKTNLLKHQSQALQWMIDMERPHSPSGPSSRLLQFWRRGPAGLGTNEAPETTFPFAQEPFSGGILADDMGLGKTLEMIALILTGPKDGPTLIVAPKGVLSNWESQIRRHIQWSHAPRVFRFHGPGCHATPEQLGRNDIVITTFNKLGDEAYSEGPLSKVRWRRVILDEGHNIRNPNCLASLAACKLRAKSRWACTGTPIINTETDIFSLAKFIGATATLGKPPKVIISRLKTDHEFLQNVMTTICLRRTKDMSFINLKLPEKEEELVRIEFSEAEKEMYQKLFEDAQAAAVLFFKTRNYVLWNNLLERLLRLRQMCDHWTLCRKKGMEKHREELDDLLSASAGKPAGAHLSEVLRLSLVANIACGVCSEALDIESDPVIIPCMHVFCGHCLLTRLRDKPECPLCNDGVSAIDITEMDDVPQLENEMPAHNDHSAKTKALMSLVTERLRVKGSKIVIFSQWTSFLDIISRQLDEESIQHTRIDGTMSTQARDEAVRSLQGESKVMLASLRAAGVGISLVAADTVIVSDSWWAPAVEEQAVDRVHRLGQTRRTKVYRLVIQNAVEESVLQIQDKKRQLVGTAFQEDFKSLAKGSFAKFIKELLT